MLLNRRPSDKEGRKKKLRKLSDKKSKKKNNKKRQINIVRHSFSFNICNAQAAQENIYIVDP